METADPKNIADVEKAAPEAIEQLSQLFGSYKAEWLKEQLFDLFTEPQYFPELVTSRPCMLLGGRGTGKTTVLRSLSYEGQFALSKNRVSSIGESKFFGMYYRVNTNRVTAFRGPELEEEGWIRVFAHYVNLLFCDLILRFLQWYELHTDSRLAISDSAYRNITLSLDLPQVSNLRELADQLNASRFKFESYINNIADGNRPRLSMQGAPLDVLMESINALPEFRDRLFFFLLDEYENFEDYQQRVINTLVKHSSQLYSFKIGIKELGWRSRTTLNPNEQLISPADYVRINIPEKLEGEKFSTFALSVCNERMARLRVPSEETIRDVSTILPGLSEDREADILGIESIIRPIRDDLQAAIGTRANEISSLRLFLLASWAEKEAAPLTEVVEENFRDPIKWNMRYDNYKHALLFMIRKGKRGITKYYAGWNTFSQLAACNIRYLLELVDQSLLLHITTGNNLSQPVSVDIQTKAAQKIGEKNLSELQGLSVHGARLTKLLLGLGRIFGVMAANAVGHAPEVTQFHIKENGGNAEHVEKLLNAAVMHLALLRLVGTKPADEADTRECDYMIHPIFAPFFVFSYRKKRKMLISGSELLKLVEKPQETITEILAANNRAPDDPLPEQLTLFESYYGAYTGKTATD